MRKLKKAFGKVWRRFLEFEISRCRVICEVAGDPLPGLVLKVLLHHNLNVVQSAVESENYAAIREQWEVRDTWKSSDLLKKLSYAAISDMTGIVKETISRTVMGCCQSKNRHSLSSVD